MSRFFNVKFNISHAITPEIVVAFNGEFAEPPSIRVLGRLIADSPLFIVRVWGLRDG
jgi:hypothetical protein